MRTLLIAATALTFASATAVFAQSASPAPSGPTLSGQPSSTQAPADGSGATSAAAADPMKTTGSSSTGAMPDQSSTGGAMASGQQSAEAVPATFPLCSAKVQDNCQQRSQMTRVAAATRHHTRRTASTGAAGA